MSARPRFTLHDLVYYYDSPDKERIYLINFSTTEFDDDTLDVFYEAFVEMKRTEYLRDNDKYSFDNSEEDDALEDSEFLEFYDFYVVNWTPDEAEFMVRTFNVPLIKLTFSSGSNLTEFRYLLCLPITGTDWSYCDWDYCSDRTIADQYENLEYHEHLNGFDDEIETIELSLTEYYRVANYGEELESDNIDSIREEIESNPDDDDLKHRFDTEVLYFYLNVRIRDIAETINLLDMISAQHRTLEDKLADFIEAIHNNWISFKTKCKEFIRKLFH